MTVTYLIRESKRSKSGLFPIECSISHKGARKVFVIDRKVTKREFNSPSRLLQDYLDTIRRKFYVIEQRLLDEGLAITTDSLIDHYKNGFKSSKSVGEMFDAYLAELSPRIGKDLTLESFKKYTYVKNLFLSLVDKSTLASDITNSDGLKYINEVKKKYKEQTAFGYITKMKSFFIYGLNNGYIKTNPMASLRYKRKVEDVEFLTSEEIKKIEDYECDCERIEKVKDLFLFSCYTGISYCDTQEISVDDIMENEFGKYIQKERIKTKVTFTVLLNDKAIDIMKKYNGRLPTMSNQKLNSYLKEIKDICRISKPLHFHIARHTAATQFLNKGLRLEVVSKILGHSSIRQTTHYAKLLKNTVLEEMSKVK